MPERSNVLGTTSRRKLVRDVVFVAAVLALYCLLSAIPLPGLQPIAGLPDPRSAFSLQYSVGALAVAPYATAYIVGAMLLALFGASRAFEALMNDSRRVNWLPWATLVAATISAYFLAVSLEAAGLAREPGVGFRLTTTVLLAGSTMALVLLARRIPWQGALDGVWLIYVADVIASILPLLFAKRRPDDTGQEAPVALLLSVAAVALIVLFDLARSYPGASRERAAAAKSDGDPRTLSLSLGATGLLAYFVGLRLLDLIGFAADYLPAGVRSFFTQRPLLLGTIDWVGYGVLVVFLLYFFSAQLQGGRSEPEGSDDELDGRLERVTFLRAALLVVLTVGFVAAGRLMLKEFVLNGVIVVAMPLAFLGLARGLGLYELVMPSRVEAEAAHQHR